MEHNSLLQWIYAHILDEHMNSDPKQFAIELRMTERTIDNALHKEGSAEYALLFERLLTLCAEKNISVDGILRNYINASD